MSTLHRRVLPDTPPTAREVECLTAWARHGGYRPAGRAIGSAARTIAYGVESLCIRLQVKTPFEAAERLGITVKALDPAERRDSSPRPHTPLTQREKEVLAACLLGTRREAAKRLGIHWSTVRAHMRSICIRLQVEDRVEAALVMGWLCIPDEYMTGAGPSAGSAPVIRRQA